MNNLVEEFISCLADFGLVGEQNRDEVIFGRPGKNVCTSWNVSDIGDDPQDSARDAADSYANMTGFMRAFMDGIDKD